MKLLLSSDGKTAIDNIRFLTSKPLKDVKLAWVITATKTTDENSNYLDLDLQAMLGKDLTPHIYDVIGKTYNNFKKELNDFDIIFVEGGNTFFLLKMIRESGFDKYLNEWIKTKPYIGVSAGSYIVCPTIEMSTWKHAGRSQHGLTDLTGLGYIDFLISVHYKDEYRDLIKKGMEKTNLELKILKDGQALFIDEDKPSLVGNQEQIAI